MLSIWKRASVFNSTDFAVRAAAVEMSMSLPAVRTHI
jgi:hypothetical protein